MSEPMNVIVELWALAADDASIWLISGEDAWRTGPVPADSEPHFEMEMLAGQHLDDSRPDLYHSTSWRVDGPHIVLTYVAVLHPADGDHVRGTWRDARPVTPELYEAAGRPIPHDPLSHPPPATATCSSTPSAICASSPTTTRSTAPP